MTVRTDRRAVLGAVLAGAAGLSTPSLAATSSPRDRRNRETPRLLDSPA